MMGMRDFFRKKPDATLADQLAGYPPFGDVHVAAPKDLSEAEAKANLDAFLARREERLDVLAALLSPFEIDLEAGLDASDHKAFLDQIDRWAAGHWKNVPATREQLRRDYWQKSDRSGGDIVYSMLRDVALLLGEMIVRRREGTLWGLDPSLKTAKDGAGFRRPVVLGLANPATGQPVSIETDQHCFTAFAYIAKAADPAMHGLTQYCRAAIDSYPLAKETTPES